MFMHHNPLILKKYNEEVRGRYDIDTEKGQSGSPVYLSKKGEEKV
jgi:V8-like Glu-specific endopeptidase